MTNCVVVDNFIIMQYILALIIYWSCYVFALSAYDLSPDEPVWAAQPRLDTVFCSCMGARLSLLCLGFLIFSVKPVCGLCLTHTAHSEPDLEL